MGEVSIFPFSLGRGRATLHHIIYSARWFNCQRGKRSQPIVRGLYMDWTLRSKFSCLKNVTPTLSLWHSFIWEFYTWNLASKGRPKSPLRSDTNEGHLCCTLKKEFCCLMELDFLLIFKERICYSCKEGCKRYSWVTPAQDLTDFPLKCLWLIF